MTLKEMLLTYEGERKIGSFEISEEEFNPLTLTSWLSFFRVNYTLKSFSTRVICNWHQNKEIIFNDKACHPYIIIKTGTKAKRYVEGLREAQNKADHTKGVEHEKANT